MVEKNSPWPRTNSGERRSFESVLHEAWHLKIEQTGEPPSLILIDHAVEASLLKVFATRFNIRHRVVPDDKPGKYYRGVRLIVTSDVQLAVA